MTETIETFVKHMKSVTAADRAARRPLQLFLKHVGCTKGGKAVRCTKALVSRERSDIWCLDSALM